MSTRSVKNTSWLPKISLETLRLRAKILNQIRNFFSARDCLEVETPLLSSCSIPDPNIHSIAVPNQNQTWYLQTSPEFAMKRLLASGSGSIYQICKAFRAEEKGNLHNPEFTILEWYRINFDHHELMDEMQELLECIFAKKFTIERLSYEAMFQKHLELDPHRAKITEFRACAAEHQLNLSTEIKQSSDRDLWLNTLLTHLIEPKLGQNSPTFIYDYPVSQAALARIRAPQNADDVSVAERFEVYINGIELANGFHELAAHHEQRQRFLKDLSTRQNLNLPKIPLDENLLAALKHGLPNCAGVALGIDRLVMLVAKLKSIEQAGFLS